LKFCQIFFSSIVTNFDKSNRAEAYGTVIGLALKFPEEIDIPHNSNTNNIDKVVIE